MFQETVVPARVGSLCWTNHSGISRAVSNHNILTSIVAFLLLLAVVTRPAVADIPVIKSASVQNRGNGITIKGDGFGDRCTHCEVLADYGKFKYRLNVESWSDRQITAELPDLGLSNSVKLVVKAKLGSSDPQVTAITPQIVPSRSINKLVKPKSIPDLVLFEFRSQDSLGDKGDNNYQVSAPSPQCDKSSYLFDHAKLVLGKRTRFGQARIVKTPEMGCTKCLPLSVRYFYEPTGALHYQLHVYRRKIDGICNDRMIK